MGLFIGQFVKKKKKIPLLRTSGVPLTTQQHNKLDNHNMVRSVPNVCVLGGRELSSGHSSMVRHS